MLHWSNGFDLDALDRRVLDGSVTDADFADALVGEPASMVCRNCQAVLRVLIVDTGHPVFSGDRARRLREHTFVKSCPVCGGDLGGYVLELLD